MSFVFDPAAIPTLPIEGREHEYPVHRIFCVGRNYVAHADEMGVKKDEEALRVTAHGLLHMMGERDKSDSDKKKMRKAEENALVSWAMFHVEHGK